MFNWYNLVWALQVLAALAIICLVLLQHGKGADAGAAFGAGASGSLFGASGSSNFLSRSTAIAAAVFFAATLALAFLGHRLATPSGGGVFDNVPAAPVTAPVAPAAGAPAAPAASAGAASAPQSSQIPK